jgi:hypothetical protein
MKTNTQPDFLKPPPGSDRVSPNSDTLPASSKEQELDELRRFRVRTVPPDVRRQWLLAEAPVAKLELLDTVPEQPNVASNPLDRTPSDIRALRASTRKIRTVEPRPDPSLRLIVITTATVIGILVFAVVYFLSGRRPFAVHHDPALETRTAPIEDISASAEKRKENTAAIAPTVAALPRAEPTAPPPATASPAPAKRERARAKDPESSSPSSRTMPAAARPPSGTDIKTPLFGN